MILTIHGVMDERPGQFWRPGRTFLSPRHLLECIRAIRRRYRCVSLAHAIEMLRGQRSMEPNCVVITLDDGYRNQATEAWPILRDRQIPATFFVVTAPIERPAPFWFDRMDYAFQHLEGDVECISIDLGEGQVAFPTRGEGARMRSCYVLRQACKSCAPERISSVVGQVEAMAKERLGRVFAEDDWSALMSVQDVQRLAGEGADIGSHTADHVFLDVVDGDVAYEQLVRSKRSIERWTGGECAHFCFPAGRFKPSTIGLVRKAGYKCAMTTVEGGNRVKDDVFALRRIGVPANGPPTDLIARMTGISQKASMMRKSFRRVLGSPRSCSSSEAGAKASQ